jgi:hypothetical protein
MMKMAVIATVLLFAVGAFAQTYNESVIYYFGSQNDPDGVGPFRNGLVFDAAGNLYATTMIDFGTLNADGAVVELSPQADNTWLETVLYVFNRQSTGFNGYYPVGTLAMDSKGNLYGTTIYGGSGGCTDNLGDAVGCGTVYELSRGTDGAWTPTVLYNFQGSGYPDGGDTDGAWPEAGVTLGNTTGTVLYGTTSCGGTGKMAPNVPYCPGTVYELKYTKPTKTKKGGWGESVIYNFPGPGGSTGGAEGWWPLSALLLKSGKLYGTTCDGGSYSPGTSGAGTVYELTSGTPQWKETVLHSFDATDGACPMYGAPVMESNNLYGTANQGGADGYGTAWELAYSSTTKTYTEQTLYSFGTQATDGTNPNWGLVPYNGSWYGTTGGWQGGQFGAVGGTAFKLTDSKKTGWQETTLWTFSGSDESPDVAMPGWNQLVVDKDGNLYGMAPFGPYGEVNAGGIFELSPK